MSRHAVIPVSAARPLRFASTKTGDLKLPRPGERNSFVVLVTWKISCKFHSPLHPRYFQPLDSRRFAILRFFVRTESSKLVDCAPERKFEWIPELRLAGEPLSFLITRTELIKRTGGEGRLPCSLAIDLLVYNQLQIEGDASGDEKGKRRGSDVVSVELVES